MAWFKSIQDIHHQMLQKDRRLALQVDVTATPRHDNGAIFVQTVSDYPLVEAIHQNVVKHPVLPDAASRAKLHEHKSAIFTEKYADYLALGIEEWRKSYAEHELLGQEGRAVRDGGRHPQLRRGGRVPRKDLPRTARRACWSSTPRTTAKSPRPPPARTRKNSNCSASSPTTSTPGNPPTRPSSPSSCSRKAGTCATSPPSSACAPTRAESNILPEQTLGRGLRRMYFGTDTQETVSVMGTPAFMEFVESIQSEGVSFEHVPMGGGSARQDSLIVEVDTENPDKNLDALDIPLPKLTRRYQRDFKDLDALDPAALGNKRLPLKPFTPEETREIVFKTMLDSEIHHTIQLDGSGPADYRSVVAFFARQLLKDLRLVGGYDVLYGKVKTFMREHLFTPSPVNLEDPVVLRNLSEPDVGKVLYDAFKTAINALTIQDAGTTRIEARISPARDAPLPHRTPPFLAAKKSIFNKTVGEPQSGGFELSFAAFLEAASDVTAFAKNYLAVGFKLDYVKADGDLSTYTPDFIVRTTDGTIWIVETKGREELDLPHKMARLKQWCADATAAEEQGRRYDFVFVDQPGFEKHTPNTFAALAASFTEYKNLIHDDLPQPSPS